MTMHVSKKMLATTKSAAAMPQGRQFVVGYSMPRCIRAKVQASCNVAGHRKKSQIVTVNNAQNPMQQSAMSPTGKMAVGPWLGPFETHPAEEVPTTLYLDNMGSAHLSLDDVQPALDAASSKDFSMMKMSRAAQRRATVRMAAAREGRAAMWTRCRGAHAVMATHQINQARPRSMK